MAHALLTRLARFLRNLITSISRRLTSHTQRSPRSPQTVWVLDPDALTEELHDPALRQFYTDHLESCLAMPARQRQ